MFTLSTTMMLVRLVQLIHMTVLVFVLAGWLLPIPSWLWAHAFFIPLLILHWRTNQNQCYLTQLEARLKANSEKEEYVVFGTATGGISAPVRDPDVGEGQFIKTLWKKVFGRAPSDSTLEVIIYGLMAACWTLGISHLAILLTGARIF